MRQLHTRIECLEAITADAPEVPRIIVQLISPGPDGRAELWEPYWATTIRGMEAETITRLPGETAEQFEERAKRHFPEKAWLKMGNRSSFRAAA